MATDLFVEHGIIPYFSKEFSQFQIDTINNIVNQIEKKFYDSKNLVVNSTWLTVHIDGEEKNLNNFLKKVNSKIYNKIFFVSLIDDPLPDANFLKINYNPVLYQIGNVRSNINFNNYFIQLSCVLVEKFFKFIPDEQLNLDFNDLKLFLCYQNKPHVHREYFTSEIIKNNLLDDGIITLNRSLHEENFQFKNKSLKIFDIPENKFVNFIGNNLSREDPYTFGNLDIWNKCFLNIVSETIFDSDSFFTEKTYKPIIGLRPFVIINNSNILKYLNKNGFYTFEEYWNEKLITSNSMEDIVRKIISIINYLKTKPKSEIISMYNDMLPKLKYNKNLFFEHVQREKLKLNNIFIE